MIRVGQEKASVLTTRLRLPLLLVFAAVGCVRYHPQPLDPARLQREFQGRRLTDPRLVDYLRANSSKRPVPPSAWDLDSLALAALFFHPDVQAARARVEAAQAAIRTAGARPNPVFSYTVTKDMNPPPLTPPWTRAYNLDVPIELPGKRGLRIDNARRDVEVARWQLDEATWRARSRVRSALVGHLFATRLARELAVEERSRAESVDRLERRLDEGEASRPDVETARAEWAAAQLALRGGEGRVWETQAALASALGVPSAALDGQAIDWPGLEQPPAEEALPLSRVQTEGLLNRLDVQRSLAEYASAEAALHVEISKQYPDILLSPGYAWDQGEKKYSLGVSVELPIFNHNQGPIAEAQARRHEAGVRLEAAQAAAIGELEQALARYKTALRQLKEAEQILQARRERESAAQRALEIGQEDALALALARVARLAAERARLETLQRSQVALGALEDAVQRPLDGSQWPEEAPRGVRPETLAKSRKP